MKKIFSFIFVAIMMFSLVSCGEYEDLNSAIYETYSKIQKTSDDNKIQKLFAELYDFYLEDLQRNFYYRYDNRDGGMTADEYLVNKHPEQYVFEKDDRSIYVKSKDEVYIVPFSKEHLVNIGIDADNIETIDNSELYKYRIVDFDPNDKDDEKIQTKVGLTIILKSCYMEENYKNCKDCYSTVEITYQPSNDYYLVIGYFADMIGPKDNLSVVENNLSNGFSESRVYHKTEQEADEANERIVEANRKYKEERSARLKQEYENEQGIANSIPQVGMTKAQVRKSLWGSPDDINKTTYSWGTTEQWVYDDKGYVYFKNDIVDAVSEK